MYILFCLLNLRRACGPSAVKVARIIDIAVLVECVSPTDWQTRFEKVFNDR